MNNAPDKPRKALGKGLSALLPARPPAVDSTPVPSVDGGPANVVSMDRIDPNPLQPRTVFDPARLQELADSIIANGIIQPLIVRRRQNRFELIAGERRLRAAKLAGLSHVPVVVQDHADGHLLEIALVENIQREDLNPIETAQALERLAKEMNLSHEEIGRRTGKDRVTVTNLIRLLRLPDDVQLLLAEHRLSMGHARALLGLPSRELQIEYGNRAAAQGYSVRQVERQVQDAVQERAEPKAAAGARQDPNVKAAATELENILGTRVRIVEKTDQRGRIEIEYYSQDDLNRLYDMLVVAAQGR
jgi:ParB family transcriptional regulator, chromosome partitioning protein